jgi:hypothetical protein
LGSRPFDWDNGNGLNVGEGGPKLRLIKSMNDELIRENFHRKVLRRYHVAPDVLVVDELGLVHGRGRADIAIVNGRLVGYELKSNQDTLDRLDEQVALYNAVFDRATLVVGERHAKNIRSKVPKWWGITVASHRSEAEVSFKVIRGATVNRWVKPFAVAQLLWHEEAAAILEQLGEKPKVLRQRREVLYQLLTEKFSLAELRRRVTGCLKSRKNWRSPGPRTPSDDWCPPTAR